MNIHDLLNAPVPTVSELALKYRVPVAQVQKALQKGIQVEQEHTTHTHVARQIALAHLAERLDYYDQLSKIDERTTRTSKTGAPGTLKAKISREYGGAVTCDKVQKLKMRSNATAHDVRQANWYQNMNCGGATRVDEIFQEPARQLTWRSYGSGEAQFWETGFRFDNKHVVIEAHPDVNQMLAKYMFRKNSKDLDPRDIGWNVIFLVNGSTDVTGEMGTRAATLFGKVISILKGFLAEHNWDYVVFTGAEGSRDRLYYSIARRLADQLGGIMLYTGSDFLIHKRELQEDAAGVGRVVPGVNMPADIHPDEISRQARKWGFKLDANGVPPVVTQVNELFQEPALKSQWHKLEDGPDKVWSTQFKFYDEHGEKHKVVVEMHKDVGQANAKFVLNDVPSNHKGWVIIFHVDGALDVTGMWGYKAAQIFSKVVQVVRHFLDTHKWDYVVFTGQEGSRNRFYEKLIKRLADQIGGHHVKHMSDFLVFKS